MRSIVSRFCPQCSWFFGPRKSPLFWGFNVLFRNEASHIGNAWKYYRIPGISWILNFGGLLLHTKWPNQWSWSPVFEGRVLVFGSSPFASTMRKIWKRLWDSCSLPKTCRWLFSQQSQKRFAVRTKGVVTISREKLRSRTWTTAPERERLQRGDVSCFPSVPSLTPKYTSSWTFYDVCSFWNTSYLQKKVPSHLISWSIVKRGFHHEPIHSQSLTWTLKSNHLKRKVIFQPSFSGVKLLNFRGVRMSINFCPSLPAIRVVARQR